MDDCVPASGGQGRCDHNHPPGKPFADQKASSVLSLDPLLDRMARIVTVLYGGRENLLVGIKA